MPNIYIKVVFIFVVEVLMFSCMNINFFLYRRLCKWITCEFQFSKKNKLSLQSKYEVASFKDVFCHPFYWQVFSWIEHPPKLVVDCGAHCGHFSILADLCFQSKFDNITPEYILVEPNPFLIPVIKKNLSQANLTKRVQIIQGLLGLYSDEGTLWIPPKNYLQSSLKEMKDSKPYKVKNINLAQLVGDRSIDLLKIDIEGGEFDLIKTNLSLFEKANLIFMELHNAPESLHQEFLAALSGIGLNLATKPLRANGQQLMIFQKQPAPMLIA